LHIGGKKGAILRVRVGGMSAERIEYPTRMLPDAAPLIPVEAQSPKQTCGIGFSARRDIQPNPFADNLRNFVFPVAVGCHGAIELTLQLSQVNAVAGQFMKLAVQPIPLLGIVVIWTNLPEIRAFLRTGEALQYASEQGAN
jgi:hypothetical protein